MKKNLIKAAFVSLSLLLGGCTGVRGSGDPIPASRPDSAEVQPPGGDPLEFESFTFTYSGMMAGGEYLEGTRLADGGLRLEYYYGMPDFSSQDPDKVIRDPIRTLVGDKAFYDEIAALLGSYQVSKWNGFSGANPPGMLDGYSGTFTAALTGGGTIDASGSNNFPPYYNKIRDQLIERLTIYPLASTQFATEHFALTLPETWPGIMTVRHSLGYVAFEFEADGKREAALIIDDETDGYYGAFSTNHNSDGEVRAGRLIKESAGDDTRFLTVRKFTDMQRFRDKLSPAAQQIADSFDADMNAIIDSIEGVGEWTFVPEDGSVLYESDARALFDHARSLWLNLELAGEYAGGAAPVEIGRKRYRPAFPAYSDFRAYDFAQLRELMTRYFSEKFTGDYIGRAAESGKLLEQDRTIFASYDMAADPGRYSGYCVAEVRDNGGGSQTIVMEVNKSLPTDEKYYYSGRENIEFPVIRNDQGQFVFDAFPYWEKAEAQN